MTSYTTYIPACVLTLVVFADLVFCVPFARPFAANQGAQTSSTPSPKPVTVQMPDLTGPFTISGDRSEEVTIEPSSTGRPEQTFWESQPSVEASAYADASMQVAAVDSTPSADTDGNPSPSPSVLPLSAEVTSRAVCVDAAYLQHVPRQHLVHREHIAADVLCVADSTLPCATEHHAVVFRSKLTSYADLCAMDNVRCMRRRSLVNSVLSHRWQLQTHRHGEEHLELTMYDVRHPVAMQLVLHWTLAAVRHIVGIGHGSWVMLSANEWRVIGV